MRVIKYLAACAALAAFCTLGVVRPAAASFTFQTAYTIAFRHSPTSTVNPA